MSRLRINYTVLTKVRRIEWRNQPDGYFVNFEGSWESMNFGVEPPKWDVGDTIKITFERIDDAQPSKPSE